MNVFPLCGVALIAFSAIEIIGKEQPRIAWLIGAVGALLLIVPAVISLSDVFGALKEKIETFRFFGSDQLFRAFGIGLCCEVTSDVLKDSGKAGLANALDFSCKAAILLLCVPLWKELFSIIGELVS